MESIAIASPLNAFLQQPNIETSPAWEFIHGEAQQKTMPTNGHGDDQAAMRLEIGDHL